ncbi:YdbH family protein [Candidatus Symbiopectobacterium sp. NZEC127]|uniref:YdbH family protein n=1 Tax=Candidatus Symbiopectobacterium sp. NZEC127 TaxID=2820472 RepID=UPI002227C830|nr:YdbH family protein [Candidatus Symbiopectobacterium sp. NZEC127]MCW2485326.1 YdbH family protein [Candidatus Symbiopectobacterium sp. NZEC127]
MRKCLFAAGSAMLLALVVWYTSPQWLAAAARSVLPEGASFTLKSRPVWIQGVNTAGVRIALGDCVLLDVDNIQFTRAPHRWRVDIDRLTLDTACLPASSTDGADAEPALLAQWQARLFAAEINIGRLAVLPWDSYAGQLHLVLDRQQQSLRYQSELLSLTAKVEDAHFTLESAEFSAPDVASRLVLRGEADLAESVSHPPLRGALQGRMESGSIPDPLTLALNWQGTQGVLRLEAQHDSTPLVSLPWKMSPDRIDIENGVWRWPYAAQPLSGNVSMTLHDWRDGWQQTRIDARLNMLTQGHNGRANAVLVLGPGRLGLLDSALRFQLTGQANLADISLSATIPGEIRGSVINPTLALLPGSLLRAWGRPSAQTVLEEARWPLAGLRLNANGVNGRLQAIVRAQDRYWGRIALHLDGQAHDFWPDSGRWQWRYWGEGRLPPLGSQWDVAGHGRWEDSLITVEQLSSGLDQLRYGHVLAHQPRLTLTAPLQWQRKAGEEHFAGALRLTSQRVDLGEGGYLPPSQLLFSVDGRSPSNFQWQGDLNAQAIGPVALRGRWDGERLRGMGWWAAQPLTVFQPLLSPKLNINVRSGEFYAQVAFSAARQQGFSAGGHWVVKNGSAWLPDGEVRGVNFVLPYRFAQHRWEFGVRHPVTLHIDKLVSVFTMQDIHLALQGAYPFGEDHPLILSQAEMGVLGGRVSLSALRWPLRDPVLFTVEGVDLSELVTALKIKQFALSGKMSGVLPLDFTDPNKMITRGQLRNDKSLTLRLDQQLADELAQRNMAQGAVVNWLRYLEISRAYASVDMTPQGEMALLAHIEGKNSTRSRQKPVILNYRHWQDLSQLWQSLRFGGTVQDTLEQRANERE